MGASFKSKAIWDAALEKLEQRLASLKRMYLSIGERIILIKSTVFQLAYLFIVPIPSSHEGVSPYREAKT